MKPGKWLIVMAVIIQGVVLGIGPALSRADDTAIYGTITADVPPNVLILFDNSGSMGTLDVPGEPYLAASLYSGSYTTDAVYRLRNGSWQLFADNVDDLQCTTAREALLSQGYVTQRIRGGSWGYICGGTKKRLRMGNYLNYDQSGVGDPKRRIDVAQEVVTDLIASRDDVRFGVMVFNYSEGGYLLKEVGTPTSELITAVNALYPMSWTPLGETLAEAGLYFAGRSSWFNAGVNYTSPMQERCQRNYIIVMTDGEATMDDNWRLRSGSYINGDTIGDYDGDGDDGVGTNQYLDDVSGYLYENDCNGSLGSATSFPTQNIITYTIGFKIDHQLLRDTAQNGGGRYYTANNISGLAEAFDEIMSAISEDNAVFVAPVVPVSRMNRVYAGDRLYLGFFKPQYNGRWLGNLKKYALGDHGTILSADGVTPATTDAGAIKDNARSFWSDQPDGPNVHQGGAGGVLLDQYTRYLYTYKGAVVTLTHGENRFIKSNTSITAADLAVDTQAARDLVIDDVYAVDRSWTLGDIVHSEPAVIHYDDKTVIYLGANDGMLHALDDLDGHELWGFIPPYQLERLKLLDDGQHTYFVDGSPVVYPGENRLILFFGERRGGIHYYGLDISDYNNPYWLYSVGPNLLDPDPINTPDSDSYERLGQSWAKPQTVTIQIDADTRSDVFLMGGGYDTNQDAHTPAVADSVGRAVLTLDVLSGQPTGINFNAGNLSAMTHCIVDVTGFDPDGDGIVNRIYAGDLGGNLFFFRDDDSTGVIDGSWQAVKLFSAPGDAGKRHKIFYAPDGVAESSSEMIFFGTGDRADPTATTVQERFYAIENDGTAVDLTESDLVDVTDNLLQMGDDTQKQAAKTAIDTAKGWFIRLEHPGEKVVASPRVFGGVVYFTTYTPAADSSATDRDDDPCGTTQARGVARLYAVAYRTGEAVEDFSETEERDAGGHIVERGKLDRSKIVGNAIPSGAMIAILQSGPRIYIGVEGGVKDEDTIAVPELNVYYWRQQF